MKLFENLFFWRKSERLATKKAFRKLMPSLNNEARFTRIYETNYWSNEESRSGDGSTLEVTENLRKQLPILFKQFAIGTVFDGPCGDFNWMRHVVENTQINYIGGDIVEPLIKTNQESFGSNKINFIKLDLTKDALPNADLMICRDCLFHLSYADTLAVLKNYLNAEIPYLLTTSYINDGAFENKNIETGHFRMIDLFSAPYFFPNEVLFSFEDWMAPAKPRLMCLWSRSQIADAVKKFELNQ